jgi:predicted esterase YcpF (UPF0227 family)
MLIYFHGHLGQNSKKPGILEQAIGEKIFSPRYHDVASFKAGIESACAACEGCTSEPILVAGISLGGFAAYCVARMTGTSAVVINPAIEPWNILNRHAPDEWIDYCRALYRSLPQYRRSNIKAIINTDDELLAPFGPVLQAAGVDELIEFERGGHEATNFESEIVPLIVAEYTQLLGRSSKPRWKRP